MSIISSLRLGLLSVLAVAAVLASGPKPLRSEEPGPAPKTDTGADVYRKTLRATVWVHSDRGQGRLATGTGSVVDRGRRLVLTNYHVVADLKKATVFFPAFVDGKAISDKAYYRDRAAKLGIPGEIVELDKQADLALIRLERMPEGVGELKLAAASPEPGQTVHSIGNPGRSDALWVYTPGKVRQVYNKKWKVKLDEKTLHTFEATVVETDSPTNPGDSGGPLVNDTGELVGVTQGGAVDAQLLSTFIDVSEVRKFLNRRSVQMLRAEVRAEDDKPKDKQPAKSARAAVLTSTDAGKFFTEESMKKAQAAADLLFKEKKLDMFIETFDTLPKEDGEKLAKLSGGERETLYKKFAKDRAKTEKITGVYLVITRTPTFFYLEIVGEPGFPPGFGPKLKSALLNQFKADHFDEGLTNMARDVLEAKGIGGRK